MLYGWADLAVKGKIFSMSLTAIMKAYYGIINDSGLRTLS